MNSENTQINYVEFRANDLEQIKQFYQHSFGWSFTDYGPTYVAFSESGLEGGFEISDEPVINGALVILYSSDLDSISNRIVQAGGRISKDIFSFPGGHRFHFKDPSGNELAVWSDCYRQ
jgi:predicted enzyme related to lactoylglutathione lyase